MAAYTCDSSVKIPLENMEAGPLAGKRVWTRIIINEEVATDEIGLDAKHALRQDTFIRALDKELEIIDWSTSGTDHFRNQNFQGKLLCVPIIVLEETDTSSSHHMKHARFGVVEGNTNFNWSSWVQRNLLNGNVKELKAEVHYFILEDDEHLSHNLQELDLIAQDLTMAGKGLAKLEDKPLIHIEFEDLKTPLRQWLPFFQATPMDPGSCECDLSTNEYFPEPYIEDPLAFSATCELCHGIARERGLLQEGRCEKTRANYVAAETVGEGDASGELTTQPSPVNTTTSADISTNRVTTTNTGDTPTLPIDTMNTEDVVDMEEDERLARALQAKENGLRRRTSMRYFKGM